MAKATKAPTRRYVKPQTTTRPLVRAIPKPVASMVGRVMILSGLIEYQLLVVAKRLAGVGLKQAKVMFGNPRWSDYLDRIAN
jgi:hypothetical protein